MKGFCVIFTEFYLSFRCQHTEQPIVIVRTIYEYLIQRKDNKFDIPRAILNIVRKTPKEFEDESAVVDVQFL